MARRIGTQLLVALQFIVPLLWPLPLGVTITPQEVGDPPGVVGDSGSNLPSQLADTALWTKMAPSVRPTPRDGIELVYDAESDRMVLFGGDSSDWIIPINDTWAYDLDSNAWTEMTPATSPESRHVYSMSYDAESDRVVLFGGTTNAYSQGLDDTWTYDLNTNTWTEMSPELAPHHRWSAAMAYDEESDRIVMFGGASGGRFSVRLNDTWAYDLNQDEWVNLTSETGPRPRGSYGEMAYYPPEDRIILLVYLSRGIIETWSFDYNTRTWQNRTSGTEPTAIGPLTYDIRVDRVVCFAEGRTWTYQYGPNRWLEMNVQPSPPERRGHALGYDAASEQVILFGGNGPGTVPLLDDTWSYRHGSAPPVEPGDVQATPGASSVNLSWQPPSSDGESPITGYRIYGRASEELTLLAVLGDVRSYHDPGLQSCRPHYYQISAINALGEGRRSDTVSAVPAAAPCAPQDFWARAGDGEVDLFWQPPITPGLSPLTGYRIHRGTTESALSPLVEVQPIRHYTDTSVMNGATYYYQIRAVSEQGAGVPSVVMNATPNAPPDTIAPLVFISSPVNGSTLDRLAINVTGTAFDNVGLDRVEVSLDAQHWKRASGTESWFAIVSLEPGSNRIYARAFDTSGNVATATVTATVQEERSPVVSVPWEFLIVAASLVTTGTVLLMVVIYRKLRPG